VRFECLACYRCTGQEKWNAENIKDEAFKFLFCQLRPSRKMQNWHCYPIWALRLSLTSQLLPEISSSLLSLLKILLLCPKGRVSHHIQAKGRLGRLSDVVGSRAMGTHHFGAQDALLQIFAPSLRELASLKRDSGKSHRRAQLLTLFPYLKTVQQNQCTTSVLCQYIAFQAVKLLTASCIGDAGKTRGCAGCICFPLLCCLRASQQHPL